MEWELKKTFCTREDLGRMIAEPYLLSRSYHSNSAGNADLP